METAARFVLQGLASAAASWERLVKDLGKECKCRQLAKWGLIQKGFNAVNCFKIVLPPWRGRSKQYYLTQIPPSKLFKGLGM